MRKNEKETPDKIQNNGGFAYELTFDEADVVNLGDYVYDFELHRTNNPDPIIKCETERMVELVRLDHKKPFIYRRSSKIIATDDPMLTMNGVNTLKLPE